MERGHILGRGKVYANGSTALANGTAYRLGANGGFRGGAANIFSSSSDDSSSSSSSSAQDAEDTANAVSDAADEAAESYSELVDWIEVALKRVEEAFDTAKTYAEDLLTAWYDQNKAIDTAISKENEEVNLLHRAVGEYQQQAIAVGLSSDYVQKIVDGTIDIENITDENLKNQIDDYTKWYEKALGANKKMLEIQKEIRDLKFQKFENISSGMDNQVAVYNAVRDASEALNSYYTKIGTSVDNSTILQGLETAKYQGMLAFVEQRATLENYLKQMDETPMQFDDPKWLELETKVAEIKKAIAESRTAMVDLQDQINEINVTKIQLVINELKRQLDLLSSKASYEDAYGAKQVDDYTKQIQLNNASLAQYVAKRKELISQQSVYAKDSQLYSDLGDKINEVNTSIYGLLESNEKLKDSIHEVRWTNFNDAEETLDNLINEYDGIRKLMPSDSFINKDTGELTNNGIANVTLIGSAMSVAKQKIADYTEGLHKLAEEYQNGGLTTAEYEKDQQSYLKTIRDSASSVEDYKNSLIDLYKNQMQAENTALKDSISKRKEALQAKKDYYEYDKTLRDKNKDINAIKAQIAALQGVTNASAIAARKKLEQDLATKEEDLTDTKTSHEYEIRAKGYDDMSTQLEDSLNDTLDQITTNSAKQEEVISNMLSNVVAYYKTAYSTIQGIISNTGISTSPTATDLFNSLSDSSGAFNAISNATQPASSINAGNAASSVDTSRYTSSSSENANRNLANSLQKPTYSEQRRLQKMTIGSGSAKILNKGDSAIYPIILTPSDANVSLYYSSSDSSCVSVSSVGTSSCRIYAKEVGQPTITCTDAISGISVSVGVVIWDWSSEKNNYVVTVDPTTNTETRTRLRGTGYANGTLSATAGLHKINEQGNELVVRYGGNDYTMLSSGDGVIRADITKKLMDFGKDPAKFISKYNSDAVIVGGNTVDVHYDNLINIEGNATPETVEQLKAMMPNIINAVTKEFTNEYMKIK